MHMREQVRNTGGVNTDEERQGIERKKARKQSKKRFQSNHNIMQHCTNGSSTLTEHYIASDTVPPTMRRVLRELQCCAECYDV
jgi:hypothetical protein